MQQRGSWRAKDRIEEEPQHDPGCPEVPEWLRESARPFWAEAAKLLDGKGVLTKADGAALVLLSEAIDDYVHAESEPKFANETRGACFERLLKVLKEFGLTPASRANVKVDPHSKKTAADKVRALLNVG